MVNGWYENKSVISRRAFALYVFADGTMNNTDNKLLKEAPIITTGEKIEGKFYSLLYESNY